MKSAGKGGTKGGCELYHVPQGEGFAWKWRSVDARGRAVESDGAFALYYDCVLDARAHGFQPELRAEEDTGR